MLLPDTVIYGAVLPVLGEIEAPAGGILVGLVPDAPAQFTARPGFTGRDQFPRLAPIIAAL